MTMGDVGFIHSLKLRCDVEVGLMIPKSLNELEAPADLSLSLSRTYNQLVLESDIVEWHPPAFTAVQ